MDLPISYFIGPVDVSYATVDPALKHNICNRSYTGVPDLRFARHNNHYPRPTNPPVQRHWWLVVDGNDDDFLILRGFMDSAGHMRELDCLDMHIRVGCERPCLFCCLQS